MHKINKPNKYTDSDFYDKSLPKKQTANKIHAEKIKSDILALYDDYDNNGKTQSYYKIKNSINAEILKDIYKGMSRSKKETYNYILSLSSKCAYCSQGITSSIDHFLPKGNFPSFSIYQNNLIPCCGWCNNKKLEFFSNAENNQMIHPYYEDIQAKWLSAECKLYNDGYIVNFYVNTELSLKDNLLYERIDFQFKKLKLNELYSVECATYLTSDSNFVLRELKSNQTFTQIQETFKKKASDFNLNSWQWAYYNAISENKNFCKGITSEQEEPVAE